jgi:hypothetical protein
MLFLGGIVHPFVNVVPHPLLLMLLLGGIVHPFVNVVSHPLASLTLLFHFDAFFDLSSKIFL